MSEVIISKNDVAKIAKLAKIAITESEMEIAQKELSNIFALIEKMQQVPTQNVQPMTHSQDIFQRLRSDEVSEMQTQEIATEQREQFLNIAPETENNHFIVPKFIE